MMAHKLYTCLSSMQPPKLPESPFILMPPQASTSAEVVDWLFYVILWVCTAVTVGVVAAMVYFTWKYRAKSRLANEQADKMSDHNTVLEVGWSVPTFIITLAFFIWGFQGFVHLRTPPKDALEVQTTAQKWSWLFEHNGFASSELHVPVDTPVRVVLRSTDVLHSLWVPAFRTKMDAVPGRYTDLWFKATQTGEFPIHCAEYCGLSHSDMYSKVVVHTKAGFEEWKKREQDKAENMPLAELGAKLAKERGCLTCHSIDGTPLVGPTWKGIFGKEHQFTDGTAALVDENYLKESIENPQAKIVLGYPPSMPTFKGQLNDRQLTGLVEYIKTLK
jgi:cytochrome c oxidase subunit 2